ncbi:MAG TPA: DEAD/DEAH box helicase, partial [Candidatus Limnocylindrales bacterium]|nr:DEAD/DEAH box helicase [Candidatus Limnocylindrales bacterium]
MISFDSLGLRPELLRAVAAEGYTEPTPVQAEAIPAVLDRRDVLAGAQTGTGKTAAFVLPILQLLNTSRPPARHPIGPRPKGATGLPIRCLILTPTRELALQAEEFIKTYGKTQPIRATTIYGGVGYDAQIKAIQGGPEIVVATPGRLLDIAGQGKIDLRRVEILVLDEADRMLDMGFIRDIRRILALLPSQRQSLMFSATFSDDVTSLAATFLRDPAYIQIARRNAPIELVRQVVYPVDRARKRELLSWLVRSGRIERALVFTRTKHGANRLAEQLDDDGIEATAIHGNKSQGQRIRALDEFKDGRVEVLVATEVAARGLDIDELPHVVNYELPTVPEDYIHRIGRTGRAGLEGDAVSLVSAEEGDLLAAIELLLRKPIPRQVVPGFEPARRLHAQAIEPVGRAPRRPEPRRAGASSEAAPRRSPSRGRGSGPGRRFERPMPGRPLPGRPMPGRPFPTAQTA